MRLLSNLHVKGKPAVLPDREIRSQSHYFIYRPCTLLVTRSLFSILWEVADTKLAEIRECNLAQNYRNDEIRVLLDLEKVAVKFYNLCYCQTIA